MKLKHIDNSFYRLTPAQAKKLCVDRQLPRDGYEKRADPVLLPSVTLLHRHGDHWIDATPGMAEKAQQAWVKRTPLSYHDGAPVKDGWTWAIHLYFSPSF